ncbi:zinc ABC transporter substrate-binding protein [soil metagenome]
MLLITNLITLITRKFTMNKLALLAIPAVAALALAGCSTGTTPPDSPADTRPLIVASTSTYGNIAEFIGGDLVSVTSIITSPDQDPHSYEASAQDQLALSKAALVIENGGGYDPFIENLLLASDSKPIVINASEESGLIEDDHAEENDDDDADDHIEGFNEHVWYSLDAIDDIAEAIADQLAALDPGNTGTYTANYEVFSGEIARLEQRAEALKIDLHGQGAAVTEPVAVYLLDEVGLVNQTPADFTEAIEEGTDVPPLALQDTLALFTDGRVIVLAYNEQTSSTETEQVRAAAEAAGIPVVSFTETLPQGTDYIDWMSANLDALETALAP